jgi:hypothetical protein
MSSPTEVRRILRMTLPPEASELEIAAHRGLST